jgi:hypothetical protein
VVTHLVLFKPRPDLSATDRQDFIAAFERAVRDIPAVRGVRVGARVRVGAGYEGTMPDTADIFAAIDFDDLAGLRTYLDHPRHRQLGELFWASLASTLVYDFEVGGIEQLRQLG